MVYDDGVAGEGEVPGQHHDAVGRGAAGVARDGVEFRGVRSAALLAAGDFGLAEVHEGHVILRRAGKASAPQLFAGGLLIEGPDGVAELGVGSFGGFRFGFDLNRAEILRNDSDVLHHRLAAHSKGHFMRTGSGIVGRRDIGAPPAAQTDSLHIAEVCFHRGSCLAHHAGESRGHRAALLHPFGGKLHLGACLQRKAERVIIPTDGLRGLFEPDVLPQLAGAAALELGGQHIFRQTPDGQLGLIVAVGGEKEVVVGGRSPLEDHIARAVGDGQRAVAVPLGQSEGRVGVVEDAKLLHREGAGAGEDFIHLPAQQRHLPAPAVGLQLLPGELHLRRGLRALRGERITHAQHRRKQHHDAQRDADEP